MNNYDDIINHSHHQSSTRPHMSPRDRAAQFAPFAALTGYDDLVVEEARLTDKKIELSDSMLDELNRKQQYLLAHIKESPLVTVVYFVADDKKSGGRYVKKEGDIKRIDECNKAYIFKDGTVISFKDVIEIQSEVLPCD